MADTLETSLRALLTGVLSEAALHTLLQNVERASPLQRLAVSNLINNIPFKATITESRAEQINDQAGTIIIGGIKYGMAGDGKVTVEDYTITAPAITVETLSEAVANLGETSPEDLAADSIIGQRPMHVPNMNMPHKFAIGDIVKHINDQMVPRRVTGVATDTENGSYVMFDNNANIRYSADNYELAPLPETRTPTSHVFHIGMIVQRIGDLRHPHTYYEIIDIKNQGWGKNPATLLEFKSFAGHWYAADAYEPAERKIADGCCSAINPCSHQRNDPYSLCETCTKANSLSDEEITNAIRKQNEPASPPQMMNWQKIAAEQAKSLPIHPDVIAKRSPGKGRITAAEINEAEGDLEHMKTNYLKQHGWEYTCSTPGSLWVWRRDFIKEDTERLNEWSSTPLGPYGKPSKPRPWGIITAPLDMAVTMTKRLEDDR